MSLSSNLLTYSWSSFIYEAPFEIKVFAHSADEARQQVLDILDEITCVKPEHEALDKAYGEAYTKLRESRDGPAEVNLSRVVNWCHEQLRATVDKIPANFSNSGFAATTFDYTPDQIVGLKEETTLGEFIRTTEPKCSGPIRMVSFHCFES
jgi:hypothetical protein